MKSSKLPLVIMLTTSLAGLAGCGNGKQSYPQPDEPFAFSKAQELALPIKSMTPATAAATQVQLRRDGPQVARLYLDALTRFDSIYGEGVGPAKREADYLNCKAAFHAAAGWIGSLPVANADSRLEPLWTELKHCRDVARRWSGPAEMATFGSDLNAMTDDSMLVVSYAATASNASAGPRLYADWVADNGVSGTLD